MRRATLLLLICMSLHAADDRPGGIVSTYNPDGVQIVRVVSTGQVFTIDEWDAIKEQWARAQSPKPRRVKPARKGAQLLMAIGAGRSRSR